MNLQPCRILSETDNSFPAATTGFLTLTKEKYRDHSYSKVDVAHAAVVAVLNDVDEILMINAARPIVNLATWELPRGGIDLDETPHEAAARELWEETGVTIPADNFSHAGMFHQNTGLLTAEAEILFTRTSRDLHVLNACPEETLGAAWVPVSEVVSAIQADHISDAITVAALLKLVITRHVAL